MKKIRINKELADKYIYFFLNRGCLITEGYTKVSKDPFSIKNYENLFITINAYKPGSNTRESENIEKFSGFLFDIDMGKNPSIKDKKEIEKKVLDYYDYDNEVVHIDFVNETKNGFHLISLIKNPKIIKDYEKEELEYKNKYNEMIEYLNDALDLKIDDGAKKTSQISSIPGSYRYKDNDGGREGGVVIKILRGENLLEISDTKQRINELSVEDVLAKLDIHMNLITNSVIEDGRTTNGRKVNKKENYLNNFTNGDKEKEKRRLKGKPFNIVLNYFNNLYGRDLSNYNKTWEFFRTHFGIIGKNKISSSIRINMLLNQNLFLDKELSQENKKYLLSLEFYLSKLGLKELKQSHRVSLTEFKKFLQNDKIKLNTLKDNLVNLNTKILKINTKEKCFIKQTKLINIEFKKEKGVKFRFQIFPEIKKDTNVILYSIYLYQYLNSNIIKLNISNNLPIDFYLYLNSEFFSTKLYELYIENTKLDSFGFNKNISLRKKILKSIGEVMGNFDVKKEQDGFIFIKTLKKDKKDKKI